MVTDNFTGIAKFVAKLAYIYVVCNTYIPRVYIRMLVASCIAIARRRLHWCYLTTGETGGIVPEFMKCNS